MSTYNYFGVTVDDIVNYYHGTTVTDYNTGSVPGSGVIISELEYSEQKVLEALPPRVANSLMNGLYYVYVFDQQKIDLTGATIDTLYSMTKYDSDETSICGCSTHCAGDIGVLTEETVSVASITGAGIVSITNYDPNKDYYADITFTEDFEIGSLKRLIRDLTACRLGSQLFSRGSEDEWVSVTRACEESTAMLDKISNDEYWYPYEMKKLKFFPGKSPIKSKNGLTTIKVGRS